MQDTIEHRNKNFFKHDWESQRKDFEISLRRKKRQDFLKAKRSIPLHFHPPLLIQNYDLTKELSVPVLRSLLSSYESSPKEVCYQTTLILISASYKDDISEINLLIECGCIEFCLNYIQNSSLNLSENLLLTLSNIAATGTEYRQKIIDLNFLMLLPKLLFEQECSVSFLKTVALALQNLIQNDVKLETNQAEPVIIALENLITLDFPKINMSCLYVVNGLSSFPEIKCFEYEFIVDFVMDKAGKSENNNERLLGLKAIGNFVCDSFADLRIIMKKGVFEVIEKNLGSQDSLLLRKSCLIVGNLLESPFALEFEPNIKKIYPLLLNCISNPDISVRNESSFVLCSLGTLKKSHTQWEDIELLVKNGLFSYIVEGLEKKKSDIFLNNILKFLYLLMKAPDHYKFFFKEYFFQSGCYETLEQCQLYCSHYTSDQISNFLSEYFGNDEEEIDEY